MTEEQINRIYIRTRLRYIMQDCLITDELVKEIRQMLVEIYQTGIEKGKVLQKSKNNDIINMLPL